MGPTWWPITFLFLGLDVNSDLLPTSINKYTTVTTLVVVERGDDGFTCSINRVIFQECTGLLADDVKVFDRAKAREGLRKSSLGNLLSYSLCAMFDQF